MFSETHKQITKDETQAYAVTAIGYYYGRGGFTHLSSKLFEFALQTVLSINDEDSRAHALIQLSGVQAEVNQVDQAFATALHIPVGRYGKAIPAAAGSREEAYGDIAEAQAKLGHFELAYKAIQHVSVISYRYRCQVYIARLQILAGYKNEGLEVFDRVWTVAPTLNMEKREIDDLLVMIVLNYALVGEIDEAQRKMELFSPNRRDNMIEAIAEAYARERDFESALKMARDIQSRQTAQKTFAEIAKLQVQAGLVKDGFNTLSCESLEEYIHFVADCSPIFDEIEPKSSMEIIKEVLRLATWNNPTWGGVLEYMAS